MPPHNPATAAPAAGPLRRITAMAARADPEARAKIVSVNMAVCFDAETAAGKPKGAGLINHSFIHCRQKEKPAEYPAGFHLEEEMGTSHPNFLASMLVILIIKVKIIIRKR